MRTFNVVIGSRVFFQEKIASIEESAKYFLDMVRLHDAYHKGTTPFPDDKRADSLIVKNDSYLALVEQACERLDGLIYELTTEDAIIWIHNPPSKVVQFLERQFSAQHIKLEKLSQEYDIDRNIETYKIGMESIRNSIIGQDDAIVEVSKSIKYLASVERKNPYVIMLYGNSSIGKTELVKEIAKHFFGNFCLEKHLSMFRSNVFGDYLYGDKPNRCSLGYDLLERESNLIFLDEFDKCDSYFYSAFYTLFDNEIFKDAVYDVNISGCLIILTSNYSSEEEMKEKLGMPIYYRIDKFIHFEDFNEDTIYKVIQRELDLRENEYKDYISKEKIYSIISKFILSQNENGRTIKNKIQQVIEAVIFESNGKISQDISEVSK